MAAREEVMDAEDVVLEAEAVEEPQPNDTQGLPQPRRLPERSRRTDVDAWRGGQVARGRLTRKGSLRRN